MIKIIIPKAHTATEYRLTGTLLKPVRVKLFHLLENSSLPAHSILIYPAGRPISLYEDSNDIYECLVQNLYFSK